MSVVVKWWARASAAVSGAVLALVVPVHAWAASNGVADVAIEAARYRSRRRGLGFFGLLGGVCCLFVVAAVVLTTLLIVRSRGRRRK
jgi:hypothetical protein